MFTGIIKAVGNVGQVTQQGGDMRLTIRSTGLPWSEFDVGESISVNGVCLTAVELLADGFVTDVSSETLNVTALQGLGSDSRVNLEPSLALGERLGGHLVSGHVDCIGEIKSRESDARSVRLEVEIPDDYRRYVAKKGSVCIDGVSLTVNAVSATGFSVNIIPHTAEVTIIGDYGAGDLVNIEVDLLARYLERLLKGGGRDGITKEFLRAHGYV
ncbi:MAG: riboflavin synthase [Woeseiaceae bacterium]